MGAPSQALRSPQPRALCTSTRSSHRAPSCRHACQGDGFLLHSSAHWLLLLLLPDLSQGPPHSQGRPQNAAGFLCHTQLSTVKEQRGLCEAGMLVPNREEEDLRMVHQSWVLIPGVRECPGVPAR